MILSDAASKIGRFFGSPPARVVRRGDRDTEHDSHARGRTGSQQALVEGDDALVVQLQLLAVHVQVNNLGAVTWQPPSACVVEHHLKKKKKKPHRAALENGDATRLAGKQLLGRGGEEGLLLVEDAARLVGPVAEAEVVLLADK